MGFHISTVVAFSCFLLVNLYVNKAQVDVSLTTEATLADSNRTSNSSDDIPQDLYVIKTVVYEVGILTDASSNDTDSNETQEQVDVTYFNPLHSNSSSDIIDFSKIPIPIQTNVSGVSVTGLLPLGSTLGPHDAKDAILPKEQVQVTQNISTTNPEKGSQIISNLGKLLGLEKEHPKRNSSESSSSEESDEDHKDKKKEKDAKDQKDDD